MKLTLLAGVMHQDKLANWIRDGIQVVLGMQLKKLFGYLAGSWEMPANS